MSLLCVWLWQFQNRSTTLVGEVEVAEFVVASPQTGVVSRVFPGETQPNPRYSSVTRGQLLVQLDDAAVRDQLNRIQKEFLQLSEGAAVELARVDRQTTRPAKAFVTKANPRVLRDEADSADGVNAKELAAWRVAAAYAETQLKQVEVAKQGLDLRQLDFEIMGLRSDAATNQSVTPTLDQAQRRRAELELAMAKVKTELAFGGAAGSDPFSSIDETGLSAAGRALFRSFRRRCELTGSQLAAATKAASSLDARSPVEGQVEDSHVNDLQAVVQGEPLMTVVRTRGSYVVAFARERGHIHPFAGMSVILRSRSNPSQQVRSAVESVGAKIDAVPMRQQNVAGVEEWGRPMRIPVPSDFVIEPGGLIDVVFDRSARSE